MTTQKNNVNFDWFQWNGLKYTSKIQSTTHLIASTRIGLTKKWKAFLWWVWRETMETRQTGQCQQAKAFHSSHNIHSSVHSPLRPNYCEIFNPPVIIIIMKSNHFNSFTESITCNYNLRSCDVTTRNCHFIQFQPFHSIRFNFLLNHFLNYYY